MWNPSKPCYDGVLTLCPPHSDELALPIQPRHTDDHTPIPVLSAPSGAAAAQTSLTFLMSLISLLLLMAMLVRSVRYPLGSITVWPDTLSAMLSSFNLITVR